MGAIGMNYRKQKDYLDAIEKRLAMRYPNERKYNKGLGRQILPGEYGAIESQACSCKASTGGNVPVQTVYQVKLQPNSQYFRRHGS